MIRKFRDNVYDPSGWNSVENCFMYISSMIYLVLLLILAYLLGSIPTSVWMGKALRGLDLREHGSGNAGATNAFRVLGKLIGSAVLILDMLKGFLAVSLVHVQGAIESNTEGWMILKIGLGLVAVCGHIFPVFAAFRGGKGVATTTGVALALHPYAALAAMGIYLLVFLLTRISALGSLLAVLTYPVWIFWVFRSDYLSIRIFSLLVLGLVFITHRANILRLVRGEEKSLFRKKSD